MATCVYYHPLRTITVEWQRDSDGVAVLQSYADTAPIGNALQADCVIVHSERVHVHRYPVEENSDERQTQELQHFLPEVDASKLTVHAISSVATSYQSKWATLLAFKYPNPESQLTVTDIEADIRAIGLDGTALFLGKRGPMWWVGAVDDNGAPLYLENLPDPEKQPLGMFLHETVNDLLQTTNLKSRRLVIFGDSVTPEMLTDLSKKLAGRVDGIERLSPFHHVRSALSEEEGIQLLRRSHLLGCLVGAIALQSNSAG